MKHLALALFPALAIASSGAPKVAYHFDEPTMGQYSVPGVCEPIHDASSPAVTLERGELLQDALDRLPATGGVIDVAFGFTTPCDTLKIKDHYPDGITLRGLDGKLGRMPVYYCRTSSISEKKGKDHNYQLGGHVPHDLVPESFLFVNNNTLLIENLEIDGYKGALKLGSAGQYVIRNSYLHHGPGDGIFSSNTGGPNKDPYRGIADYNRFSLEVCGSEISHYGQGNHKHNFYMHRGLGGGGDVWPDTFNTWSEITIVDSFIHSPGWASAYKSIANENTLINNVIATNNGSPPTLDDSKFQAQMLIDVPACSINTIRGNELIAYKTAKNAGSAPAVGLRGRRTAMRGCDVPLAWFPYKHANAIPPRREGPVHTEEWWIKQAGKIWFPTTIEDNKFVCLGESCQRQEAIKSYGTRWLYEGPKKVNCFLPHPQNWYERSRVYLKNNTFEGYSADKILVVDDRKHNRNCPTQPRPAGPVKVGDIWEQVDE